MRNISIKILFYQTDIKYFYHLIDVKKFKAITLEKGEKRHKDFRQKIDNLLKQIPLSLDIRSYGNIILYLDKAMEQNALNEGYETAFNYYESLPTAALPVSFRRVCDKANFKIILIPICHKISICMGSWSTRIENKSIVTIQQKMF